MQPDSDWATQQLYCALAFRLWLPYADALGLAREVGGMPEQLGDAADDIRDALLGAEGDHQLFELGMLAYQAIMRAQTTVAGKTWGTHFAELTVIQIGLQAVIREVTQRLSQRLGLDQQDPAVEEAGLALLAHVAASEQSLRPG